MVQSGNRFSFKTHRVTHQVHFSTEIIKFEYLQKPCLASLVFLPGVGNTEVSPGLTHF